MLIDDPKTNCILYRRTNPQLMGGLWPNARSIYENLPKNMTPRAIRDHKMEVVFKNGAKIKYQQAENVSKSKNDAQGQEFTFIGIDEGTQFEWEQIEYFMSRLRSPSKHFSRMVISCNPSPDHTLRSMIDWYLDESGYAIPERDGVVRYFVQEAGEYIWGDSKKELGEKLDIPKNRWEDKILSFSFVSGTIYDNPVMMEINPSYLAFLEGLNDVDKAQLLYGCWDARAKGANYWQREWIKEKFKSEIDPSTMQIVRSYDLAATERSQVNKYPDPTACCKVYKDRQGYYYIAGDYHEDFYDDYYDIYGQFCKRSGDRDNHIIKQAHHDGTDCTILLPVDVGASGKTAYEAMASNFMQEGFMVKPDPTPNNKTKLVKFQPFATACFNGLVYFLVDTFDKKTLEFIYKQLEAFDGERSTTTRHDEFPDLLASAYNYLQKSKVHKAFSMPRVASRNTPYAQFKSSTGS